MGTAFLKMDQSRVKWRFKLAAAFNKGQAAIVGGKKGNKTSRSERWGLFLLPFITVIRVCRPSRPIKDMTSRIDADRSQEGLEAVVFVGGVGPSSSSNIRLRSWLMNRCHSHTPLKPFPFPWSWACSLERSSVRPFPNTSL